MYNRGEIDEYNVYFFFYNFDRVYLRFATVPAK
uniref:Uncharacterized protein n=1 Tax=Anguilla anguilla TaxID=7936 RepID=A0A0E9UF40_ANGAN